jgi:hypothetical protein
VARPDSYAVQVTAIRTHDARSFALYRTWDEYITENPAPTRPSGVLAVAFRPRAAELAVAPDRRDVQGIHRL